MTSVSTPLIYCDYDDMQCGAWQMDFYEQTADSVNGVKITIDEPAPGWVRVGNEHLCPDHADARAWFLADVRAKIEALEHDTCCSEMRQEAPCDCLRADVLDLFPKEKP